jgi:plastocyanin
MRKLSLLCSLAIGLLLLASCGSSTTTSTPTPTTMPAEQVVNIKDFRFDPDPILIVNGTTLTWINQDTVNHQILFDGGPLISMSPILKPGDSWRGTFLETGDFPYSCTVHPTMKGTVSVRLPVDIPPSHSSP